MQISEVLGLAKWYTEAIDSAGVIQSYSQLSLLVTQNAERSSNQSVSFENEKNDLFQTIKGISFQTLTLEQEKYLERLNITDTVGQNGINQIEEILYKNGLDIATAASKLQEITNTLTEAKTTFERIYKALSPTFSKNDSYNIPEGNVQIRVYFKDGVAIDSVVDFKKLGAVWYDIGRGISMAQNGSPEDFAVIGTDKGSIIIDLSICAGMAIVLSKAIIEGLKVVDKFLDIMKKAEEIKALKLSNKKIDRELRDEADAVKKNGIEEIMKSLISDLNLSEKDDGDKISALKKSVELIVNFTNQGGAIDIIAPEKDEDDENASGDSSNTSRKEIHKLTEAIQEIRMLETRIKLLENK